LADFPCLFRLLLYWLRVRSRVLISVATGSTDASLDEFVEAGPLILPQVQRVVLHTRVNVALFDVLFLEEASDFACVGIISWLLKVLGKVCLPVGVHQIVAHGLEGFNLAFGPLVEVD